MIATPDILCIGSVLWDIIGRTGTDPGPGGDVPGRITRLPGGVALNIAGTLAGFGLRPALLSAVGTDPEGCELVAACARAGLITEFLHRPASLPTDRYMAIEGPGGLIAAVADAHSLEAAGAAILAPLRDGRLGTAAAPWQGAVVLDGNLTPELLEAIASDAPFAAADLRLAPASPGKAARLAAFLTHPHATLYLNLHEARILGDHPYSNAAEAAAALARRGARRILVTDGPRPCADAGGGRLLTATPPEARLARVTGAGDTFMAAHLVAERQGAERAEALQAALSAAARYIAGDPAP